MNATAMPGDQLKAVKKEPTIIKTLVLPGGRLPEVSGDPNNVGYDVYVSAIVGDKIDQNTCMLERLWDFVKEPHESVRRLVVALPVGESSTPAYRLDPGCSVRVGFGVILGLGPDWFAALHPRSSTASRRIDVQLQNTKVWYHHVPIDPGFRGEFSAIISNQGDKTCLIPKWWRPAQLVFFCECCGGNGFLRPILQSVNTLEELGKGSRGIKNHGSSGVVGVPQAEGQGIFSFEQAA